MIKLEISSVKVHLTCKPESLNKMIEDRYHEYLVDGRSQYSVNVAWQPSNSLVNHQSQTISQLEGRYDQGIYVISSPNYHATVDHRSSRADLVYRSSRPLKDFEYFLRIVISHGLLGLGGFLFHSAGVVVDGKAYLFFGKSGSGKTTTARNARRGVILSDDLVGVLPTEFGVTAFSTPFWNPGWAQHEKTAARVAGFYRIVKSQNIALESVRESMAVSEILSSIPIVTQNEKYCAQLIPAIQSMVAKIGVYYLYLRTDDAYWEVLTPGESN